MAATAGSPRRAVGRPSSALRARSAHAHHDPSGFTDIKRAIARTNAHVAYLRTSAGAQALDDTAKVRLMRDTNAAALALHAEDAPRLLSTHKRMGVTGVAIAGHGSAAPASTAFTGLKDTFAAGSAAAGALERAHTYAQGVDASTLLSKRASAAKASLGGLSKAAERVKESADALSLAIANRSSQNLVRVLRVHAHERLLPHIDFAGVSHPPSILGGDATAVPADAAPDAPAYGLSNAPSSSARTTAPTATRAAETVKLPTPAAPADASMPAVTAQETAAMHARREARHREEVRAALLGRKAAPTQDVFGISRFIDVSEEAGSSDRPVAARHRSVVLETVEDPLPVVDLLRDVDPYFMKGVRGTAIAVAREEGRLPPSAANATILHAEMAALKARVAQPGATMHSALGPAFAFLRENTGMADDWLFARAAAARKRGASVRKSVVQAHSAAAPAPAAASSTSSTFLTDLPLDGQGPTVGSPQHARVRPLSAPPRVHAVGVAANERQAMQAVTARVGMRRSSIVVDLVEPSQEEAEHAPHGDAQLRLAGTKEFIDEYGQPMDAITAALQRSGDRDKWIFADVKGFHPTVIPVVLPRGKGVLLGDLRLDPEQAATLQRLYAVNPAFATTFAALVSNTQQKRDRLTATRRAFSASAATRRSKMDATLRHRLYEMTLAHAPKTAAMDDIMTLRVRRAVSSMHETSMSMRRSGTPLAGPVMPWSPKMAAPSPRQRRQTVRSMSGASAASPTGRKGANFFFGDSISEDSPTSRRVLRTSSMGTQVSFTSSVPEKSAATRGGVQVRMPRDPAAFAATMTVTIGTLDESLQAVRLAARKERLHMQMTSNNVVGEVVRQVSRGKVAGLSGVERVLLRLLEATLRSGLLLDATTAFALLQQLHDDVQALPDRELDLDMERQVEDERRRRAALVIPTFSSSLFRISQTATRRHAAAIASHDLEAERKVPPPPPPRGLKSPRRPPSAGRPYPLPHTLMAHVAERYSPRGEENEDDVYEDDDEDSDVDSGEFDRAPWSARSAQSSPRSPRAPPTARTPAVPSLVMQTPIIDGVTRPATAASNGSRWRLRSAATRESTLEGAEGSQRPQSAHVLLRPRSVATHDSRQHLVHRQLRPQSALPTSGPAPGLPLLVASDMEKLREHIAAGGAQPAPSVVAPQRPATAAARLHTAPPATRSPTPSAGIVRPRTATAPLSADMTPDALLSLEERAVRVAKREWPLYVFYPIRRMLQLLNVRSDEYVLWLSSRGLLVPTEELVTALEARHIRRVVSASDAAAAAEKKAKQAKQKRGTRLQQIRGSMAAGAGGPSRGSKLWTKVRTLVVKEDD